MPRGSGLCADCRAERDALGVSPDLIAISTGRVVEFHAPSWDWLEEAVATLIAKDYEPTREVSPGAGEYFREGMLLRWRDAA
ncbi:MAG: hypothetical protein AAF604_04490 [Acidobacteriota bacterium]